MDPQIVHAIYHLPAPIIPTKESILIRLLGPNYKVRLAGISAELSWLLAFLAALPYSLGTAATIIPDHLKAIIATVAGASAAVLRITAIWNSKQKDTI